MQSPPPERLCARPNGKQAEAEIDSRALLVEAMREFGAKGARIGCLTGNCGACSVELNGQLVKTCLVLAVSAGGSYIVTIEGSRDAIAKELHEAFVASGGFAVFARRA